MRGGSHRIMRGRKPQDMSEGGSRRIVEWVEATGL
jgi:hypothetical protein